ncbi:hypothetical protein ES288_A02G161800v1 [Gossypium darwinii]|uniref:Uncharacterized protein n=1 Tax=Gossypium darwinii TaxID=34276 RepID=A0A5D2HEL9_GOSDA|nr:hypothetical protein ES288_A02G161800v1 [Gossypium darwinii]
MSSVGASCAEVYVMQKRQKEKMKRMEEEKASRGIEESTKPQPHTVVVGRSKVQPGQAAPDSASVSVSEKHGSGDVNAP